MSWKIINEILGLAAIDKDFAQALLENPLKAVQAKGFRLTQEEQEVFRSHKAQDLAQLSQLLLATLKPNEDN